MTSLVSSAPSPYTVCMDDDEIMKVVEQRLLALDRVWDLVTNSEAADQNTIAVSDLRAAITTWRAP